MEVRRGEGTDFTTDVEAAVNEKGRYMGTPTLCVEILSRSTRSKDLVDKLKTYMLSGVGEFWAVDPDKQTVGVYGFSDFAVDEHAFYKQGDRALVVFLVYRCCNLALCDNIAVLGESNVSDFRRNCPQM